VFATTIVTAAIFKNKKRGKNLPEYFFTGRRSTIFTASFFQSVATAKKIELGYFFAFKIDFTQ